jgi:hypothetical protein
VFHAGKVGHANAARVKSTASRTFFKDGEPYTLKGVSTVRRGGHAIPTGSTVPTLLNVQIGDSQEVFGWYADGNTSQPHSGSPRWVTENIGNLGKLRQPPTLRARHTHGNTPSGRANFYPLLPKIGKGIIKRRGVGRL